LKRCSASAVSVPRNGTQLVDDTLARLVCRVLEDGELAVPIQLDIAVVRGRQLRDQDFDFGAICGHPGAGEELLPVVSVDRCEEIRGTLDEDDKRARRERDAPIREVTADANERGELGELAVDKPGEPVGADLRALVGGRQPAMGRALAAVSAPARSPPHHAAPLVLLDDVELPVGVNVVVACLLKPPSPLARA
jgi:hypothetical protein